MGEGSACFFRPCLVVLTCFADPPAQVKAAPEQPPVLAFRLKWNLVESNHVLMLFRHALNDRTSSGSMMSGNRGARTHDLLVNSQALCQLSYVPEYVLFTCQCALRRCHPQRVPVFFICRCCSRIENVRLERLLMLPKHACSLLHHILVSRAGGSRTRRILNASGL